jgi:hypothetical protein
MILSVPGVLASCVKFPHSSQLNFWSTESIFNQFSVFVKTLNALRVCLQYKHPKRVIRSDKPVTLLLLLWSHKCDFGAEPRSRIIATSAVKGLKCPQSTYVKRRSLWSVLRILPFVIQDFRNPYWWRTRKKKPRSALLPLHSRLTSPSTEISPFEHRVSKFNTFTAD